MSAALIGPSLLPPAMSLLDASDPFRTATLVAAAAVIGTLGWLVFQARQRTVARTVVIQHTFATTMRRRHDGGRAHASVA
jgi:hypothetical protein